MGLDNIVILSILPVLGQPRHAKRIAMLQESGFNVEVVAFERDYHTGRVPDCPITCLGKIENGHYLKRILKIIRVLPVIRRAIRNAHLVYASGPDMAMTSLIAGFGLNRPVILEVGDIQRIQVARGIKGNSTRLLDRYVVNRSRLLVTTAQGFVDGYYREWLHTKTPAMVIENKLDASVDDVVRSETSALMRGQPLVDRPMRIGYFGVLRCGWSWEVLEGLASFCPDKIEIVVAGYPRYPVDLPERAARLRNVEFRGEFRSPQDLPMLYKDVDLVWAVYPTPRDRDSNWLWAKSISRSNRFYESCYFQKPIVSLSGSGDGIEVERYGIGLIISDQSIEGLKRAILTIKPDDLDRWKENLSQLPREVYMYTTEKDQLERAIKNSSNHLASNKRRYYAWLHL